MSTQKKAEPIDKPQNASAIDALSGRAREVWLAGLGALASVEEEGSKVFNKLVDKGSEFEERGKKQLDETYDEISDSYKKLESKLRTTFSRAEDDLDENLQELVHKMGVPTQDEIKELTAQVEKLITKVDVLSTKVAQNENKSSAAGSSTSTAQKAAPKK